MVAAITKTSWGGSNKFEDIAFERTKTFGVPNDRIMKKVMFNFDQRNAINISYNIKRYFSDITLEIIKRAFTLIKFVKHC